MPPSSPDRDGREILPSAELPYGPLPVRSGQQTAGMSEQVPLDQLVDLSWLEPAGASDPDEPAEPEDSVAGDADPETAGEDLSGSAVREGSGSAAALSLTSPRPEADDDVHFGVAARALGVSRKTVERMVKREHLERGPSGAPATVSKRSLVTVLEQRRRDVGHLTRATEIETARSGREWLSKDIAQDPISALRDLLVPVLAPLLDEFVAVRTRAAVLESQLDSMRARADRERARDELLLELATQGWWSRRKTRKAVLRHYVLGDDRPASGRRDD
jgi:hypothetical protein